MTAVIQFNLFCTAHSHKLQMFLRGLYNLYTYDIPDLWPHIGSGKTPKQPFDREKREETFRRATEEDPSPGWTEVKTSHWFMRTTNSHIIALPPQWVLFLYYHKRERQRRTSVLYFSMFIFSPTQELHIHLGLNSMFLSALLIIMITQCKADYSWELGY